MSYVVIALSPSVDLSQVSGPFRSYKTALTASEELTTKGYNTEICEIMKLSDIGQSPPWDENG